MLITEQQMRFNARSLTATETEERDKYVQLVRSNPESSSAWSALLHHDNSLIDGKPTPHMQNFALYQLARTVLLRKPPTRPDKHFGTVMLEYATLLCREDAAEGRHFFQWLLGQQSIPQQANIYLQWAAVEVWWKNMEKAKTILRQGIEKKVTEWEKLEKKLVDYTEREAKEKERHVSIAAPPAHVHVLPPASMHTTVTPAMSVSSSSSSAASAAASVAPPTPVVSGFSQADPITPSAAVTMSVNTPANRRRFNTRLLGLSKFGGAVRDSTILFFCFPCPPLTRVTFCRLACHLQLRQPMMTTMKTRTTIQPLLLLRANDHWNEAHQCLLVPRLRLHPALLLNRLRVAWVIERRMQPRLLTLPSRIAALIT